MKKKKIKLQKQSNSKEENVKNNSLLADIQAQVLVNLW